MRSRHLPPALIAVVVARAFLPSTAKGFTNWGIVRAKQGDLRGAVEDFETALRVAPADWSKRRETLYLFEVARRQLRGN